MDSITHGLLGASIAKICTGNKCNKKTLLLGGLIANIPDIDVLILPFLNEFEKIGVHRGFTHSIIFCVITSFILTFTLRNVSWLKEITLIRLFMFIFLSLLSHLMLDIFTPYGTQLFLPFNNTRVALNNITIVDIVFTLPLLVSILIIPFIPKLKEYKSLIFKVCFGFSIAYLLFTLVHKQFVNKRFEVAIHKNKIPYTSMMTVPVTAGNGEWFGLAKTDSFIYMGKVNSYNIHDTIKFQKFAINEHLLDKINIDLADKMRWFAKGFYVVNEYKGKILLYNLQCDMQGIKQISDYIAPTAYYFEFDKDSSNSKVFRTDFHR